MKITIVDSTQPRLKILLVMPDLPGLAPLDPRSEAAQLEETAEGLPIQVEALIGQVGRREFSDALLDYACDIIHIGSHGFRGGLELSDGVLEANDLGRMLGRHHVSLCMLMACDSARFAAGLDMPAVAIDGQVRNELIWSFSREFYRYLVRRFDYAGAFEYALSRLPEAEGWRFVWIAGTERTRQADVDIGSLRAEINAGFSELAGIVQQVQDVIVKQNQELARAVLALVEVFRG